MQKRVTTWILMMMAIGLVGVMGTPAWAENSRYRIGTNSWIVAADETLNEATDDNIILLRGIDGRVQVDNNGTDPYPFVVSVDGLKKLIITDEGNAKLTGDIELIGALDFDEFATGTLRIRWPGAQTGNTYGTWWYPIGETLGFGKNGGTVDDAIMFHIGDGDGFFKGAIETIGGITVGENLTMAADKAITHPADSSGIGPYLYTTTLACGEPPVATTRTNGAFGLLSGSGTYKLYLSAIPAEVAGGTMVFDFLDIAGATQSASAYVDSVVLKNNSAGTVTSPVVYTTPIGNGTTGIFTVQINDVDISRATYGGIWWLEIVIVDPLSAGVYIADLRLTGYTVTPAE